MNPEQIKNLESRLDEILEDDFSEQESFDINKLEEKVESMFKTTSEELKTLKHQIEIYNEKNAYPKKTPYDLQEKELKFLLNQIALIKDKYDFYNDDDERDRLFPNRHDDDFDEDSMSFESTFGKE